VETGNQTRQHDLVDVRQSELIVAHYQAVFRCDGGPTIGAGHLSRCLTLADALAQAGWSSRFLANEATPSVLPRLARSQHTVELLAEDARHSTPDITNDLVVIDHYGLGADFERACRAKAALVMAIDDMPLREHDCDILLNQNSEAGESANVRLYLCGPTYALLAPDFALRREASLQRRQSAAGMERIFISFGSSDPDNLAGRAVQAIDDAGLSVAMDIAVSSVSPNADSLRSLAARPGSGIRVHFDADNIPFLMAQADIAIGAAGTTTWERCCLGLPSLIYVCADNQAEIAATVDASGAGLLLGRSATFKGAELTKAMRDLMAQAPKRRAMSERAAGLCDGGGAARVVSAIASLAVTRSGASSAAKSNRL
jgi:UDP-2,4-diacetamido-2,4,6-trideoxy-beta-L-altropyranose hydrolase